METRTKEVLELALQLTPTEQEELLAELASNLGTWDDEIEQAWAEEATRRWAKVAAGEGQTIPWSEIREALVERFGI